MKIECIICFEKYDELLFIKFNCDHMVCLKCYERLLNYDNFLCPICRKSIDIEHNLQQNNQTNNQTNNQNIIENYEYRYYLATRICHFFILISLLCALLIACYLIYLQYT